MRAAIDDLFHAEYRSYGILATTVLVETLLQRCAGGDVAEAAAAIDRMAAAPVDEGLVIREVWLLRLQALLARAGRRRCIPGVRGSLPRHGDIAGLRGPHEVGRGDAMKRGSQNFGRRHSDMGARRVCCRWSHDPSVSDAKVV
jgi:hypothetical protein